MGDTKSMSNECSEEKGNVYTQVQADKSCLGDGLVKNVKGKSEVQDDEVLGEGLVKNVKGMCDASRSDGSSQSMSVHVFNEEELDALIKSLNERAQTKMEEGVKEMREMMLKQIEELHKKLAKAESRGAKKG